MDPIRKWWVEERAMKTVERLQAHQFKALYVKTKAEAVEEIWKQIAQKGDGGDQRKGG